MICLSEESGGCSDSSRSIRMRSSLELGSSSSPEKPAQPCPKLWWHWGGYTGVCWGSPAPRSRCCSVTHWCKNSWKRGIWSCSKCARCSLFGHLGVKVDSARKQRWKPSLCFASLLCLPFYFPLPETSLLLLVFKFHQRWRKTATV